MKNARIHSHAIITHDGKFHARLVFIFAVTMMFCVIHGPCGRGDQYPFGDGEDWMPQSWKPPKIGDSKYLPTKMLGQIQIRTNQYEVIQQCNEKGIEIADLCVPFEDYEGEFDTNAKRLQEMRKRLEAAK